MKECERPVHNKTYFPTNRSVRRHFVTDVINVASVVADLSSVTVILPYFILRTLLPLPPGISNHF